MKGELLEQARVLYETVRLVRAHVMARHAALASQTDQERTCAELTIPQMNMLFVIRDRGKVTIKELADALHVSAPSASAMVDRLVGMNMVTREQSPVDRREVIVSVSSQAAEMIDETEEQIFQAIIDLLEKIGPKYAKEWCDVYARVREVLTNGVDSDVRLSRNRSEKA